MNIVGGATQQQRKASPFSPQPSPAVRSSPAINNNGETTIITPSSSSYPPPKQSTGCCRGFVDCKILGPSVVSQSRLLSPHRNQQVVELENELGKQKELRALYKMRMERTQDYLRYCLQTAQEKGFLDLILNNNKNIDNNVPDTTKTISPSTPPPPVPPPVHRNSDLSSVIDQAMTNGWYIEPHEIELQEKVGQGSTADIYKGIWRGLEVAVKCINPEFFESNDNNINFFAQEVETLSRQRHQYVLHLIGACLDPPHHGWVVTEFLGSTLKEWMHGPGKTRRKERTVPLPPLPERLSRALEISQAMQYLHEHKPMIIHRDLKPSNIFLDDALHVRVADFGHARFLSDGEKALTGETGTYVYMAPEVMRCEPYDEKCDVYSFGIILNEIISGQHPYIETDYGPSRIALEVAEGKLRPAVIEHGDDTVLEELIELIKLSWDEDATKRPSFATITCRLQAITS